MSHFTTLIATPTREPGLIYETMEKYNEETCHEKFEHAFLDELMPVNGALSIRQLLKWISSKMREDKEKILFVDESSVRYMDFKDLYMNHGISLFVYQKDGRLAAAKKLEFQSGKWDWFTIGGRWHGSILSKPDAPVLEVVDTEYDITALHAGPHRDFYNEPIEKPVFTGGVNYQQKGLIDFERMTAIRVDEEDQFREKFLAALQGDTYYNWEEWTAHNGLTGDSPRERWEEVRKAYYALGVTRRLGSFIDGWSISSVDTDWESRARLTAKTRIAPYSYIGLDGKWKSRGRMGWFGISTETQEKEQWIDAMNLELDNLPDDAYLTMLDCHI